ncbi:MAG TPA: NACHT domain-containing protein [Thermoanaerobaculia bacterium]|nr:NACHT domain-containing protein [Thermoanaerobaculia bacterium]
MPGPLPSQPPAQPPPLPVVEPPSLLVYAALLGAGGALVGMGLGTESERWSGFWLNLATELIGAVIILIIVERRLRAAELTVLGRVGEGVARRLLFVFSREARQLVSYATVLTDRITAISIRPYMDRGTVEEQILDESAQGGVLVIGSGGAGKTTLLHQLAVLTAVELLERPRSAPVPVLLPMRFWYGEELERLILRSVNRYARVSSRYLRNALRGGRMLCLLDGFDEVSRPQDAVRAIAGLRKAYPAVRIVVTTRGDKALLDAGFKAVEIPALAI